MRCRPGRLAVLGTSLLAVACTEPSPPGAFDEVTGAGWSFGMCMARCRGELTISGESLSYRVTDHLGEEVYLANAGALTSSGQARLASLTAALPRDLEPTYGCPDCADGGAAFVTLAELERTLTTTYELSRPPSELEELDAFLRSLMSALETCTAGGAVNPSPGCEPLEEPQVPAAGPEGR